MAAFDVLVAGELNVDLIMNKIEKFPEVGKEVLAHAMTLTLGSSSAIFASNLSTLGASVAFTGKLGRDNFGEYIISALNQKKVDTRNIIVTGAHSTGVTIILNFDEDRANVTYPGAMNHFTLQDISDTALRQSKHLHVSSLFLQEGLRRDIVNLFKKAKDFGLTTSIDPQWDPAEKWDIDLMDLLAVTDIFMPNVSELMAITGTTTLEAALDRVKAFPATTVIKNGSGGAYLWDGRSMHHQSSFLNKQVVDSIGAGDSFDAGFISAFLQRKPWSTCLELGALMGAVNTTHAGGTGAFGSIEQVKAITKTTFNFTL